MAPAARQEYIGLAWPGGTPAPPARSKPSVPDAQGAPHEHRRDFARAPRRRPYPARIPCWTTPARSGKPNSPLARRNAPRSCGGPQCAARLPCTPRGRPDKRRARGHGHRATRARPRRPDRTTRSRCRPAARPARGFPHAPGHRRLHRRPRPAVRQWLTGPGHHRRPDAAATLPRRHGQSAGPGIADGRGIEGRRPGHPEGRQHRPRRERHRQRALPSRRADLSPPLALAATGRPRRGG